MNITKAKDPDRVLRNAVIGVDGIPQVKKGTRIIYHVGNYADNVGQSKVGVMAKMLSDQNLVTLCQRVISSVNTEVGPERTFEYLAVVR